MKKTISLLLATTLFLSLFLVACGNENQNNAPEFYFTSEINEETRREADDVLSSFIRAFEEENAKGALSLLSEDFDCTEDDLSAFFAELAKLVESPFVPYDAYYMNNLEVSDALIKVKKAENATDYIELTPAARELYCAMYVSEGEAVSYMLSLLLTREGDEFKIAWINPSDFKFKQSDAPAFYDKTLALYKEGKLIPAYVSSCMLSNILRPGGYFRYEKDVDMEDLCYKLYSEVSDAFTLPLELEDTTASSLHEVGITKDSDHGVIPLIRFRTDVPISDELALKAECVRVISAIEKLSPGMSEVSEFVCFDVTNDEITETQASVNSKKMILAIK